MDSRRSEVGHRTPKNAPRTIDGFSVWMLTRDWMEKEYSMFQKRNYRLQNRSNVVKLITDENTAKIAVDNSRIRGFSVILRLQSTFEKKKTEKWLKERKNRSGLRQIENTIIYVSSTLKRTNRIPEESSDWLQQIWNITRALNNKKITLIKLIYLWDVINRWFDWERMNLI